MRIRLPYVGSPKPSAVWLLNGSPLDLNREGVTVCFDCGNALLEIEEVDRNLQGVYTLKIDNQYGSAKADVLVAVTGEPDPPAEIRLTEIDADSCIVTWQPPSDDGGSPITSYIVERLAEGESRWERCGCTQSSSYNVYGLHEGATYQFRVVAANIFGQSRPSRASLPTKMSPDVEYLGEESTSGRNDSAPSSSVSAQGVLQDSIFQDISARQGERQAEIPAEFWAAPDETSPDSCMPDTMVDETHPAREWDDAGTVVADDTLDSVSEFSTYQNTGYYSASPVGTVASSNDTALDIEMSELMNLITHDCSGSDHDITVMQRPSWTPASHLASPLTTQLAATPSAATAAVAAAGSPAGAAPAETQATADAKSEQEPTLTEAVDNRAFDGIQPSPPESPLMTVIEGAPTSAADAREIADDLTCAEDEVTVVMPDDRSAGEAGETLRTTSFADSITEITDDEECLGEVQVREELAESLTEPTHLHAARSIRQAVACAEVPVITIERRASLLEDIHEIDEISLKDPISDASDRLLASISKAVSATDSCLRVLERSPHGQAESNYSSISDIASLEDSIEREYNDQEQRIESLEAGLGMEMANLERDLSLLRSLQKILDHGEPLDKRRPSSSNNNSERQHHGGGRGGGVDDRSEQGSQRHSSTKAIGQYGELYNRPPPACRKLVTSEQQRVKPPFRADRRAFERQHRLVAATRPFYAERTGSIFRIPSVSSCCSSSSNSSIDGSTRALSPAERDEGQEPPPMVEFVGDLGYAPKVVSHLQNRLIQVGYRIKLSCVIDGDPCPEITWYKNGKPVTLNNRHFVVSMLDFGLCTFEIYNAKSTDTAEYSVIAKNKYGHCTTSAYLRVTGAREESPERPVIWRAADEVIAAKGAPTALLQWKVGGWPSPSIQVYHEEQRIRTDLRRDVMMRAGGECHVRVLRPNESDCGIYTCVAGNRLGRAAATIILRLEGEQTLIPC